MKVHIKILTLLVSTLLILLFSGCEEEEIKISTTVHPDGSLTRQLSITGTAEDLDNSFYPILLDETFTTRLEESESDSGKTIFYAVKTYNDISDLSRDLHILGPDSGKAVVNVELQKKFRWFYTFYTYTETWKATAQFDALPISDFLTEEELALYAIDTDTLDLDDKINSWFGHSFFKYLLDELISGADSLNDSNLTKEMIIDAREKLYEGTEETILSFEDDLEDDVDSLVTVYERILRTELIYKLRPNILRGVQKIGVGIEDLPEFNFGSNELLYSVIKMPGMLLDSNALSITGNNAEWIFNDDRIWIADYEMSAESRIVNRWALYVTGGLFAVVIILLIISLVRRRD